MSPEHVTTLVLADDHAIVREGFAALCEANGLRVLGQATDGPAALEMIRREKPDFALLDMQMPGMTGAEVIRRLRAENCTAKLMILSISRDHTSVMDALRAGADAYLLKDGPGRHLLEAMQFVRDGGIYISPLLRGAGMISRTAPPRDAMGLLSPRETEVFLLLVSGVRAKDIARRLEISPKTVDTFRASLMRKLGVHDLVGLVKLAIERNLTTVSAAG
jgi:DNA-binding NarL/FixJ family response regulator